MQSLFYRFPSLLALVFLAPFAMAQEAGPMAQEAGPMAQEAGSTAQEAGSTARETGSFRLRFDPEVFDAPFTGELFVAFAERGEPRQAMHSWFNAPPLLRFELERASSELVLDVAEAAASYPADWSAVTQRTWRVQAVARRSRTGRQAGRSPGDAYSIAVEIAYDPDAEGVTELLLDQVVPPRPFAQNERVRLFEFVSPSLSRFHGFEYVMRAGVLLPEDYGEQDSYPVLYSVTGFGGTHESIQRWQGRGDGAFNDCIVVIPDASNLYGHSVFCDSESIGPWGQALVHELIPALEREFGGAGSEHRYTTGVSSGGWASLWLQVAYPDEFAGCWSHVPDPIDFHDFQQINLYEPLPDGTPRNMYVDEKGAKRPLARRGEQVMVTYEEFVRHEDVLNPGGQIRSFEATFSPPDGSGEPRRVFDVETGEIDHAAAQAWRKYDISHTLLTRWDELREPLAGKLHVYAGSVDTFYLEGAVERFAALAEEQGILDEMVVEIVPGMAHALHEPGQADMLETISARWNAAAQN